MITKEEFFKFIKNYECFCQGMRKIDEVFNSNVLECEWCDAVSKMLDSFIYSHFTDDGADWIFYYLFESISDKKVKIKIEGDLFEEEKEIEYHLNSLEELWDFLLINKNLYFKNV
jgi:hypothetical protein